jgi:hypothetical protein
MQSALSSSMSVLLLLAPFFFAIAFYIPSHHHLSNPFSFYDSKGGGCSGAKSS